MSGDPARRSTRARQVSQRMAVVDEDTRQQAARARLDALENDNDVADTYVADEEDDEFVAQSDSDEGDFGGKKRKRKGPGKRKTRGLLSDRKGLKPFSRLLEEATAATSGQGPSYATAAAQPPTTSAARKFCSVCGSISPYKCSRCGMQFCSRKCYTVHTETRCLKFMA